MELQHVESRKKSVDLSGPNPSRDRDPDSSQTRSRAAETPQKHELNTEETPEERNDTQGTSTYVKRRNEKLLGRLQFLTLCWTLFLIGWNDSSTGPLIPRIREFYGVGFVVVSLIFVFAFLGFLIGAIANIYLTDRLGFGKTIVLGAFCQMIGYGIQSSAPPFPIFIMAYVLNGFGLALEDSQSNGFVAALTHNAETKMGFLHAAYGIGAFASPFAATQFAQLPRWSFHFLVSLGITITNAISLIVIFRFKKQHECLVSAGEPVSENTTGSAEERSKPSLQTVFKMKAVHLLAIFVLIYVGVEVTIGGWIVTFIIEQRHGGPSSGYVSSGFFGGMLFSPPSILVYLIICYIGLTVGRVALLWVNKSVGEKRVVFVYTLLCIGLELIIWFIPSLIGNAVAVSIIGMLLGPMYPIAMNQASRVLPRWILTESIGWIAGFGQAGSALLPFLTGAMASRVGIGSLQPLLVAMMAFMMVLWYLVPDQVRHPD